MDRLEIAQLIAMMEGSRLSVMELQQGDFRIRLEKPAFAGIAPPVKTEKAPELIMEDTPEIPAQEETETAPVPGDKEVRAPMVGIYHDAPSGAVVAGQSMKKGEVVCVIEAMKLMNEIVMEEDGDIAWVALKDGDMAEYDQLLFTYN